MIRLLFYEYFYSKKRLLYLLSLLLLFIVIVLLGYSKASYVEQSLYKAELRIYINELGTRFLHLAFLFIGALFLIDNNSSSEKVFIPYLSRTKIFLAKLSFFSILFLFIVLFVYIFWFIFLTNFTYYYEYNHDLDKIFLIYYLDLLIITIVSFFLVTNNKQNKMIFIILICIIQNLILEDNFIKILFYILPLNSYNNISYIIIYKTIYFLFITLIYYTYYENKNLY